MENDLEKFAEDYENLHEHWKRLETLVRKNEFNIFLKYSFNTENVMEIGLGDGIFTEMLANKFKKVYAIDGSYTILTKLKEKFRAYKNIIYIQSYIENLNLEEQVDNIVMSHILEHLDSPVEALIKLRRFCHKDTIVYLSVPNAMSLHRQVAVKMGLLEKNNSLNDNDLRLGHKRVYSPDEFKSDVQKAGFHIIKFGGSMIKPLTNKQIEDNWSDQMIQGFIELGNDYPELCGDIYIIAKRGE
ncbi:MAG TPA: class I SAM-dependent methyltransferase [Defluviitoga tunisiensis]|nr:class I SAM-dependent methyltransferase [Defluviitoga tunisiensis]